MPEIAADPPSSCYHLFFGPGIQISQGLSPDLSSSRGRDERGRFAKRSSGNPRGRPPGIPKSRAPRTRSRRPAAERAGAIGSARSQASSVAAARGAIFAAACSHRRGEASRDRPASLQTVEDCRQVLATVLEAVMRGGMAPIDGARIAKRAGAQLRPSHAHTIGASATPPAADRVPTR
jgi:hypothetical protein